MGFFSFTFADVPADLEPDWLRSLWNVHSGVEPTFGWLLTPGGPNLFEPGYDGYGVLGGRDVFVHFMVINGLAPPAPPDEDGLDAFQEFHRARFFDDYSQDFWRMLAGEPAPWLPLKIATQDVAYEDCPGVSLDCPYQGFFAPPEALSASRHAHRTADPLLDVPYPTEGRPDPGVAL